MIKKKQNKALWTTVKSDNFKRQAAALRPERTKAGGVKSRSYSEQARMEVYRPVAQLFRSARPVCEACPLLRGGFELRRPTQDIHHKLGRDGLLLFDVRHFIPVCRECHTYIHTHPEHAKKLGLL